MKKTRNAKSLEAVTHTHTHTHNTFTKILKREKSNCMGHTLRDTEKNKNYNVGAGLASAHAITIITLIITKLVPDRKVSVF
jgi:hypothetical protein